MQESWDAQYQRQLLHWAEEQIRGQFHDSTWQAFWLTSVNGDSPFDSDSLVATLHRISNVQPKPIHELQSGIPNWLSEIIARLLEESPDALFQTASDVGKALRLGDRFRSKPVNKVHGQDRFETSTGLRESSLPSIETGIKRASARQRKTKRIGDCRSISLDH